MKKTILALSAISVSVSITGCVPKDPSPKAVSSMSTAKLCAEARRIPLFTDYRDVNSHRNMSERAPNIYNELIKRKAFNSKDMKVVNHGLAGVGHSVKALKCVKGEPTTINYSSHGNDQYVYRTKYSGSYYYVDYDTQIIRSWN